MTSLTAWRSFVAVCRVRSISAAANELGYTQSAVSRHVAALEREVGARLLDRTARGVALTPAGSAFHQHALAVVEEADRAIRVVRDVESAEPPLVIGATPSVAAGLVPTAVRRLIDDVGPAHWRLVPGLSAELQKRLVDGEIDIAVVTDAPPGLPSDPRLTRTPLGVDTMLVVVPASHRLAHLDGVTIADLADESWVEDNAGSEALLRRHASRAGVEVAIDMTAADLPGKLALVATGHAVALVPGSLATALRPDVTAIGLADAPTRGLFALLPKRRPHRLASAFVDHLRGTAS